MLNELSLLIVYLREISTVSLVFRLLLAVCCGGIIGYERGKHQEAAGLRTHIFVCVGAACVMSVGQYMQAVLGISTDPARIGAQVISGIGFIGAGTIIQSNRYQIKGVTTAAGLWASAAMGLAAGIGYYECAVIMCVILHVTLRAMNRMDDQYVKKTQNIKLFIEYEKNFHFSQVIRTLRENGWNLLYVDSLSKKVGEGVALQVVMHGCVECTPKEDVIHIIRDMEGIWFVEEF